MTTAGEHPREATKSIRALAMLDSTPHKKRRGFTLLELMIVLAVILILGTLTVPRMITAVNDISLRYVATDLSGLLQSARMQAVRTNVSQSVMAGTQPDGTPMYYIDKSTAVAYSAGDPILPISKKVTVWRGSGSGAPNETTFIAGLNFQVDPAADAPSFSARGLPCIGVAPCVPILGQGFVMFVSQPGIVGNTPWAAVVVNPSAHVQIFTCDKAGNWIQRD
jgi:prepilin-type N-terminal cleavage/methylation domain-containing protein